MSETQDQESETGEQQAGVELPPAVSTHRSMVSLPEGAVDGYVAEFLGIQGVGHDREEALRDLMSEVEIALSEFDGIAEDAAATMEGAADDLESAEENPVEIADWLRDEANSIRARTDNV